MSTTGGPAVTFRLPRGRLVPLPSVSYATVRGWSLVNALGNKQSLTHAAAGRGPISLCAFGPAVLHTLYTPALKHHSWPVGGSLGRLPPPKHCGASL